MFPAIMLLLASPPRFAKKTCWYPLIKNLEGVEKEREKRESKSGEAGFLLS